MSTGRLNNIVRSGSCKSCAADGGSGGSSMSIGSESTWNSSAGSVSAVCSLSALASGPSRVDASGGDSTGHTGSLAAGEGSELNEGGSSSCSSERSEEHTSELQSRLHLVCRLLLEKKKTHVTCTGQLTATSD